MATNLYRAINNYDGDLVRANVNPATTDKVYVMATQPGSAANAWTITETVTDADFTIPVPGVFAGGDIITGADTVISAMGAGKKAAKAIDRYLRKAV